MYHGQANDLNAYYYSLGDVVKKCLIFILNRKII